MSALKYKSGDKVQIKDIDWYNKNKDSNGNVVVLSKVPHFSWYENVRTVFTKDMAKFCGKVVTIESVWSVNYSIVEGTYRDGINIDYFTDEMIEGLVEEETKPLTYEETVEFIEAMQGIGDSWECPQGYQFVDENGNVINTQKIVLEKKTNKTDDITEMIEMTNMKRNACQKCEFAVYDDNPHCGLRGFRTSFNVEWCSAENDTAPNGFELQEDGYFSWVEKKKDYPKTYEECCGILGMTFDYPDIRMVSTEEFNLYSKFIQLKRCRDAYWKLYGEEMGLGNLGNLIGLIFRISIVYILSVENYGQKNVKQDNALLLSQRQKCEMHSGKTLAQI